MTFLPLYPFLYTRFAFILYFAFFIIILFFNLVYDSFSQSDTDDGAVSVCGTDKEMIAKAIDMIKIITTDFEQGQILEGTVVSIKEFGAFIEFAPGKEGMVHISKIAKERINRVEDVLTLGDKVKVVCLGKDKMGRISFSMKDVKED